MHIHRKNYLIRLQQAIFSLLILLSASASFAQSKPNILWITIEDTSPEFIGCYGNKAAKTPTIDSLASVGTRFTNAFSTGTVCSPSRTTLITGVRAFEAGTGHHRSKILLPDFIKGFPFYMQQSGYYTSNNVKTDYNIVDSKSFVETAWNESSGKATWRNRKPGQSFFAVFNFTESHQSKTMTDPYEAYKKNVWDKLSPDERIADDAFPMPPFYRQTPEMRKQFARVYNSLKLTDKRVAEVLHRLKEDKLTDSTIIFFFSDHGEGIPRGKTNGIDLGYRVPFIVWVPPMYRHLAPGANGSVNTELVHFGDLAPTMISLAGGTVPQHMTGRIMMGAHKKEAPEYIELSTDRCDNGIDMVRSITDGRYLYSRNFLTFSPELRYINYIEISPIKKIMRRDLANGQLSETQQQYFKPRPAEFLFDTERDVWEMNNLANDPSAQPLLEKMRSRLDVSMNASKDIMLLPEYEIAKLPSQKTTAYQYRLSPDFKFADIYKAAMLSGFQGNKVVDQQVALLSDANKIVRYWAAMGLRCQQGNAVLKQVLAKAINDPYPPVSVTAAATSYHLFADSASAQVLRKAIQSDNEHIRLMAINYLLYTRHPQPFIADVAKARNAAMDEDGYVRWAAQDFLSAQGIMENKRGKDNPGNKRARNRQNKR
ncbi:sulfatase-like hydrolase/transferase [Niabella insulamsoli]|uniref:sulfatase-like hydrolase/transferase n=1 Tax=Niabella insulamsoli TaxID=3144874 RepID=UPI0031FD4827